MIEPRYVFSGHIPDKQITSAIEFHNNIIQDHVFLKAFIKFIRAYQNDPNSNLVACTLTNVGIQKSLGYYQAYSWFNSWVMIEGVKYRLVYWPDKKFCALKKSKDINLVYDDKDDPYKDYCFLPRFRGLR